MMTQTAQILTTNLGYAIPRRIEAAGMKETYCRAMDAAQAAYEELAAHQPQAASYLVPNGFNRRVLLGCHWRALDHFVSLRAAPNAHFSMRRLAQRMGEQARQATPLLGAFLRVPEGETWQQIEQNYFTRC
jgi:thymidylate synthase ThyX